MLARISNKKIPTFVLRRGCTRDTHLASAVYLDSSRNHEAGISSTPLGLNAKQQNILDVAIRVDQAGEIAANWIYKGQLFVLRRDSTVGPLIQDMWEQEKKHLAVMDLLQVQHCIRPTMLSGVAKIAGFGLGVATAAMGKEAAMACTEAVETVIGEHYEEQLKEIEFLPQEHPSVPLMKSIVKEFRDDELEHLDIAVEHHSQRAPAHALLSSIIGVGCKAAIELCKRI